MNLEDLQNKRKQLLFRSWHRGTREMDLIMGSFAQSCVMAFDENELVLYEDLLQIPDPQMYDWVSGRVLVPDSAMNSVLEKLLNYQVASNLVGKASNTLIIKEKEM